MLLDTYQASLATLPKHEWQPEQRLAVHCGTEMGRQVVS